MTMRHIGCDIDEALTHRSQRSVCRVQRRRVTLYVQKDLAAVDIAKRLRYGEMILKHCPAGFMCDLMPD